ncbi:carbohydrate-binding family 9-like protein [Poriferisphaera sp. WC338]|uniref:carbohydrate-binding family 9-like protein n=1 Tax=Poriferisphaera sp. WC338 TaxID=3425129 RepID=UPI003D8189A7
MRLSSNIMMTAAGAGVVMGLAGCTGSPEKVDVLSEGFAATQTNAMIYIDGKLNEPAWNTAQTVPIRFIFEPKEFSGEVSYTSARMLWDDSFLYVAFKCLDTDVKSFSSKHDDTHWNSDVVEFFVQPHEDEVFYTEVVVSPNGATYDGAYNKRWEKGGAAWSSNAFVGSVVTGTIDDDNDTDVGYTVELAIPLDKVSDRPVVAGETQWRFGAFRYDYDKKWEEPLLLMSFPESKAGFHYYEGYLPLRFEKD